MWNAWVLCVFVLFCHGNLREEGLQLLYHQSLSCFVNKVMTSWYYAVRKSFIIDDVGVRDPPLVCLFPQGKMLPKRLKFNEIDIYMFKVKKKSNRTRSKICSKLTNKTQNDANFGVLVSLLLTLKFFHFTPCFSFSVLALNKLIPAAICCIHFHIYRSSHPVVFFKRAVLHLARSQKNIHAEVWVQLYWNHTSVWVFF